MKKDKKSSFKKLHLVLIHAVAKPYRGETPFFEADYGEVEEILQSFMAEYKYQVDDLESFLENEVLP